MVPLSKIQELIAKHSKLEKELSSQEIDKKSFAEKSKEYSDLSDIIKEAVSYFNFQKNKVELENLINDKNTDKEMKDLAISELNELVKNNANDEKLIQDFDSKFKKELLDSYKKEYVDDGIISEEILNTEVNKWIDSI